MGVLSWKIPLNSGYPYFRKPPTSLTGFTSLDLSICDLNIEGQTWTRCMPMILFHFETSRSHQVKWDSVHQAEPPRTSRAPIPQGATSLLWLQRHGLKNHGLKSGTSGPQRDLRARQSWQAGPSPSPPCRTSTSCQPWLLASGES